MKARVVAVRLALLALVVWYGGRAVGSMARATDHARGRRAFAVGNHAEAAADLSRSVGDGRTAAELWYVGQSSLELFRAGILEQSPDEQLRSHLATAYRCFTEAITRSPASGWNWAGLADVYHDRARLDRIREGVPLSVLGDAPLQGASRSEAVALGALRLALRREPTNFVFFDQLALIYLDLHIEDRALDAVRDAARVQPLYNHHGFASYAPMPPGLIDAFAEGARGALGRTPLLRPAEHHIALGRLELIRGDYAAAAAALDSALANKRSALQDAEAHYLRAQALERLGRLEQAGEDLTAASDSAVFRRAAILDLARLDVEAGRRDAALDRLRVLRRQDPADLEVLLQLARVAAGLSRGREASGRSERDRQRLADEARRALSWAATRHPGSPEPFLRLVELCIDQGRLPEAEAALERLRTLRPGDPDVSRLARELDEARR